MRSGRNSVRAALCITFAYQLWPDLGGLSNDDRNAKADLLLHYPPYRTLFENKTNKLLKAPAITYTHLFTGRARPPILSSTTLSL